MQVRKANYSVLFVATLLVLLFGGGPVGATPLKKTDEVSAATGWVTKSSMPTARAETAVVAFGGKIYAIGGYDDSSGGKIALSTLEIYDPATDSWNVGTPMPAPKLSAGAAVISARIYVVGDDNRTFSYDPVGESWSEEAPMPVDAGHCAVAGFDGKLYAARGSRQYPAGEYWTYSYDPSTDIWISKAPLPYHRTIQSFANVNDKLYAIGGGDSSLAPGPTEITRVDIYDPTTDSWELDATAHMPTRRTHLGSTIPVVNGKVYVIGGWNGFTALSNVEVYDPSTDSWSTEAPMPTARYGLAWGVVDNKIYAIGGNWGGSGGHPQSTNEEFSLPDDNTISGHVHDSSGSPISGVTVSAGSGGSAATDASGYYTVTGLDAGTYTLTPSKSGWTFTPASRTVSVPPNATGQDFTGSRPFEVDIGFRPDPDGYYFPNYRELNYSDYTVDDMKRMFGHDAVCVTNFFGDCIAVRPSARLWNMRMHSRLKGGRCLGTAATSLRFFKHIDSHPGIATTYTLEKGDNITATSWNGKSYVTTVRRHIAYYHILQGTEPMQSYLRRVEQENTPSSILDQLYSALSHDAPDPVTLHFFWEDDDGGKYGHAITPYGILSLGDGQYFVRVYDNERPGDSGRLMEINTTNDTWSYYGTSGYSDTHTLGFAPLSKFAEKPDCPWCAGTMALGGSSSSQIWLTGQGHLLITDNQARRIGYVGNQFVNEIPGAHENVFLGGLGAVMEPIYTLPPSDNYTILLDGQTLTQTETVAITQFGPGYAISVDNVTLGVALQDQLTVAPDGTQLAYQASDGKEVTLSLALEGASESNQLQISGADVGAGQVVTLTADMGNGQLAFNNAQADGGEYSLEVMRVSAAGEQTFLHGDIPISATDTHHADYGAWDGSGPMILHVDHGSDGTIDETLVLENQAGQIYLPLVLRNYTAYAYHYDFDGSGRNTWPIRRTSYWKGDSRGVTWTEEHDGTLYMLINDKWDFAIASP